MLKLLTFWYFTVQLGGGTIYFAPIHYTSVQACEQGRLDTIRDLNQLTHGESGAYSISPKCSSNSLKKGKGGVIILPEFCNVDVTNPYCTESVNE